MISILSKFSCLIALSALLAVYFVIPLSVEAQVCSGVCINIPTTPVTGGGGGLSGDQDPSNITIAIEGGSACTDSRSVTLNIEFSNSQYIQISDDDDFTGEDWNPIGVATEYPDLRRGPNHQILRHTEIEHKLKPGDGRKEVFIRLRSTSQNVSRVYSDTILLNQRGCDGAVDPVVDVGLYPGQYVKGESFSSIYYLNLDLERQPFINETVYFTHQPDFENVIVISDELLATLPIGTPMLPKPGTVLVKVQDDPKVYYVDPEMNGQFRWIVNESIVVENFGTDWLEFLIDIPPTLFSHIDFAGSIVSDENFDLSLLISRLLLTGGKFVNDTDGDGLTDYLENEFGTDLFTADTDKDGLNDGREYFYGTDPFNSDSDDDGFTDGDEVRDGFNPLGTGVLDSDGDGLDDPQEFFYGTNRYSTDSDGDGYSDSTEIAHGFNPNGPGLLARDVSGFSIARYAISAVDLAVHRLRALLPF